jgi:predicted glycosyltransferase
MRVLIDIGHPAHVHYFKNFIMRMTASGHTIIITARNRSIIHYLLKYYNFPFFDRGKGGSNLFRKILYLILGDLRVLKVALKTKPDIFLSFGSPYAAHVAFLIGKPHLAFDDTEHAWFEHFLYVPTTNAIFTPKNFRKNFGTKHFFFEGSMDLCYLHPKYFKPDEKVLDYLGIDVQDTFVFMRFVNWDASHDIGQQGVSVDYKKLAVKRLSKICKVFISSEGELPEEIKQYEVNLPPEKIHDLLYYATLFWGESGSMATESCVLGTTAINIATSALLVGVFDTFVEKGLLYIIPDNETALIKAEEILKDQHLKINAQAKAAEIISRSIDVTRFMIWIIENYPNSIQSLKKSPSIQNDFKSNIV